MKLYETAYTPSLSSGSLYMVSHYNGQVANNNSDAWENYNSSDFADYATILVEQAGSGYYSAPFPSWIDEGILTTDVLYQAKTPGTPSLNDIVLSVGQSQGVNLLNINGDGQAAVNLGASAGSMVIGAAVGGTLTSSQMTTDLGSSVDNLFVGRVLVFTSGVNSPAAAAISAYNGTTKKLTFTAVPAAPGIGDTFVII